MSEMVVRALSLVTLSETFGAAENPVVRDCLREDAPQLPPVSGHGTEPQDSELA